MLLPFAPAPLNRALPPRSCILAPAPLHHALWGGGCAASCCCLASAAWLSAASCRARPALASFGRRGLLQLVALEPNSVGEAIAEAVGRPSEDIYYPEWFEGDWTATTELMAVELPQGDALAGAAALRDRSALGSVETYPQRYIRYSEKLIADRGYNMRGYVSGGTGRRAFESVEWEPSRPNITTLVIKRDGVSVRTETRVLRRSVAAPGEGLFNTSEVFQQLVETGGRARVTPVRVINKFKRISNVEIQVLQRVEIFPRIDAAPGADTDKPTSIYKYRGILDRQVISPNVKAL